MKRRSPDQTPRKDTSENHSPAPATLVEASAAWPLTGDVATRLNVSESSVVRMANEGFLRCTRDASGRRRYEPTSVGAAAVIVANRNAAARTGAVAVALAEGEVAAAVFEHLRNGLEPVEIVILLKIPPEVVKGCCQQYDDLQADRRAFVRKIGPRGQYRVARVLGVPTERLSSDAGLLTAIEALAARDPVQVVQGSVIPVSIDGERVVAWVPAAERDAYGSPGEERSVDITAALRLTAQERGWIGMSPSAPEGPPTSD